MKISLLIATLLSCCCGAISSTLAQAISEMDALLNARITSPSAKASKPEEEAFIQAIINRNLKSFRDLLPKVNANFTYMQGITPLMIASYIAHPEMVQELIDAGAKVNATEKHGCSSLRIAAQAGNTEVVKILLKAGADPNLADSLTISPLIIAIVHGHSDVVRPLIQAGADVNKKDSHALTALNYAKEKNLPQVINLLKQAGAK